MENEEKDVSKNNETNDNKVVENGKKALNVASDAGKNVVNEAKKFSEKDFGKFKGRHVLIAAGVVVVLILLLIIGKAIGGSKDIDYAVVYTDSDDNLYLLGAGQKKSDKAIKLSGDGGVSSVLYANTSNRYVLFEKNDALYIYDSKSKDETTKIVSDVSNYTFTENDKYVVALDTDKNLYSYNFKGDKEKIDSDVTDAVGLTNEKIVYVKDGSLYVKSLNTKKDDREKIADDYKSATLSEDGKSVAYIDTDNDLSVYTVSSKKSNKIASDVTSKYCDESCKKLYYVVTDDEEKTLYYYNGKDSEKIASDISSVLKTDVDRNMVVYSVADGGSSSSDDDEDDDDEAKSLTYTLYFKKGTKDAYKIEDDLDGINKVYLYEGKDLYYITSDKELKYGKVSGAKVNSVKTIAEDLASSYFDDYKGGYAFVADADDDGNGDLYVVKSGKTKKIDSDVNYSYTVVNNDGTKIYYMKDYKKSGDLYLNGKKIDSDVYSFNYVKDGLVYYLKDYSSSKNKGDLYIYTGKSTKIAEDIKRIASTPNGFSNND